MTGLHFRVLDVVTKRPGMTYQQIAADIGINIVTCGRVLHDLKNAGKLESRYASSVWFPARRRRARGLGQPQAPELRGYSK